MEVRSNSKFEATLKEEKKKIGNVEETSKAM